jgi:hypothetical protein
MNDLCINSTEHGELALAVSRLRPIVNTAVSHKASPALRRLTRGSWCIAIGLAVLSLSGCDGDRPAPPSAFTQAEVTAGHAAYTGYCAGCHGDYLQGGGLQGGSDAPPLTGPTFKQDWSKYSIQVLYRFASKTMPEGLEGDLSATTYSNVLSFVLAANGAKPGAEPFNPNSNIKIGDIANGQTVVAVIEAPIDAQVEAIKLNPSNRR